MKNKHDHKGTKKLKVCLFSLIMLMPILAIGFTCLYTTFNDNAYESYAGEYKYEKSVTLSEYAPYGQYTITQLNNTYGGNPGRLHKYQRQNDYQQEIYTDKYTSIGNTRAYYVINISRLKINSVDYPNINSIIIGQYTQQYIQLLLYEESFNDTEYNYNYYSNNHVQNINTLTEIVPKERINLNNTKLSFYINNNYILSLTEYAQYIEFYDSLLGNKFYTDKWYVDTTISSVFYASTDRVWQAPLFKWVMNGPFYNAMIGFTSIFGIPNQTFFTNILVYWLTMTCIYVIIDIVLEVFIYITHLLNVQKDDM